MKRTLMFLGILAILVPPSGAHASGGPYGWTISTSSTDPYVNTSTPNFSLRTLYLWLACSSDEGGMSASVFSIESTGIIHITTIMGSGFLNAGTIDDLLLAVGGCPTGPVVAAQLLVLDYLGTMCFVDGGGGIAVADCDPAPEIHPMEWIGYDNTGGGPPCSKGDAMCLGDGVAADAGPDVEFCAGGSETIGGSPTASGGTPPYTYSWSPTEGLDDPTLANPTASPVVTINYIVTVTDFTGATDMDEVLVTVFPNPVADAGPDVTIDEGLSTPIGGSPTASGGTPGYMYSWTPTVGLDDPSASNPIASPLTTTIYTVEVTDSNGCIDTDAVTVTVTSAMLQAMDIKPGSCPNPLNVRANGVLPVALIGGVDFNVDDVDPSSILLEGVEPLRSRRSDVATPFDGDLCDCHNLTSDGTADLALKFDRQEIVAALGDVVNREERVLTLTGSLVDGTAFEASDCVRILAPRGGPPEAPVVVGGIESPTEAVVTWEPSDSRDLLTYRIYRGMTPDFLPESPEASYAETTTSRFVDTRITIGEVWYYRVGVFDDPITIATSTGERVVGTFSGYSDTGSIRVGTDTPGVGAPATLSLARPTPNPFHGSVRIGYTLPSQMSIRLQVFDVQGRLVETLLDGIKGPGEHVVHWDAGIRPNGVYFYRLEAGKEVLTERVTLVR